MTRSTKETVVTRRRSQRLKNKLHIEHADISSDIDLPQDDRDGSTPASDLSYDNTTHNRTGPDSMHTDHKPVADQHSGGESPIRSHAGGSDGNNDSEDDAPEDITLAHSKQVSMDARKSEQDHIRRVDEAVKEKRRRKHELFRTQKISKKTAATLTKFPEEILEEVAQKLAEEKASKRAKKRLRQRLNRRRKLQDMSLPAESHHGAVTVVALTDPSPAEFVGGALTNDFRQQHFYGDRLRRLPILSIQAKKYRNLPAKNFKS